LDALKPHRLALALVALCVALPTVALGARPQSATGPAAPASNTTTYTDSTGEDPAGPDITTIVVSNDDGGGLTFRVNVPNRPQFTSDMRLLIWIDTDANQATGDPQMFGADYVIVLLGGETVLFKWDATTSNYLLAATQSTLSYSWSGGATVMINASDLSNTRRFNFATEVDSGLVIDQTTGSIDFTNAHGDIAPTIGLYPYQVKIGPPQLVVKSFTHAPASPVAGRTFTLRLVVTRSDTGAVLQNGQVVCVGRSGTVRLTATVHRVSGGAATCTFQIPKKAKGKRFTGSDTIVFEGQKASRSFSGTIH
jgi:hypothetical protein